MLHASWEREREFWVASARFSHLAWRLGTTKVANVFKEAFFIIPSQTFWQHKQAQGTHTNTHTRAHADMCIKTAIHTRINGREARGRSSVCGCCKCLTMKLRLAYVSFIHIFMQHTHAYISSMRVCLCVHITCDIRQHETLKYINLITTAACCLWSRAAKKTKQNNIS